MSLSEMSETNVNQHEMSWGEISQEEMSLIGRNVDRMIINIFDF